MAVVQPGNHQRRRRPRRRTGAGRAAASDPSRSAPSACGTLRTKKLRASNASSRRYSNTVPCSRLPARLGRHRDDAGAAAELRREHPRQHLELAHLLDRGRDDHGVERVLVVVDAVDQPGVRVGLMAERVEVRGAAGIERAGARQVLAGLPGRDARRQVDERREVAAVQRQLLDRPLLDDRADL